MRTGIGRALVLLMAMAASVAVLAAPQATLILRSGDRVRGELVDMGASGFTIRVRGDERTIPVSQVAVIDFAGGTIPLDEVLRMQEGRALVVLRGGNTLYGRLDDIGGNEPLRMTFRTQDGDRDVSSNDVNRIYLARWAGMPEKSGEGQGQSSRAGRGQSSQEGRGQSSQEGRGQRSEQSTAVPVSQPPTQPNLATGGPGIPVPAQQCWTNTGRVVQGGQRLSFEASGEIQLSADPKDIATPAGSKIGRYAPNAPLPSSLAGAFIGRIGNTTVFGIGNQTQLLAMPAAGQLWVGINDDNCDDNRGEYRVQIRVATGQQ